MTRHPCDSDSLGHSLLSTFSISKRRSAYKSISVRFQLDSDLEENWSQAPENQRNFQPGCTLDFESSKATTKRWLAHLDATRNT